MKKESSNVDEIIKLLSVLKDSIVPDKEIITKLEKDLSLAISKLNELNSTSQELSSNMKKLQEDSKKLQEDIKEIKDSEKRFRYLIYLLAAISALVPFLLKLVGK